MRRRRPQSTGMTILVVVIALAMAIYRWANTPTPPTFPLPTASGDGYLFCFWNVENLFDDQDDKRGQTDEEYDNWFSRDPAALQLKLDRLTQALLQLNDGKGPDILGVCEVEGTRAADLLRQALNKKLTDESLHYRSLLMKEVAVGRHIAPAIITRLPVKGNRTRLLGSQMRTLEGHIDAGGHDLVVIVSHWTSRLTDETGERRAKYADQIYGEYKAMFLSNPQVDLLVCGDFNDPPDALSITGHLRGVSDAKRVRQSTATEPLLFNLLADKDPKAGFGTLMYQNKWYTYDQILVSPGMLNGAGWQCVPESVQVVNNLARPGDKLRRPWRFGEEKYEGERGYSDHLPVTVRLKVQAPKGE
ncbi:MAG: endonuclease/exonuclease/phosphatase family protein [Planctomycetia bacterium]|nr:endonuclease/exonuclease/phosphatase family protein [Planctomycetia bacterium]